MFLEMFEKFGMQGAGGGVLETKKTEVVCN